MGGFFPARWYTKQGVMPRSATLKWGMSFFPAFMVCLAIVPPDVVMAAMRLSKSPGGSTRDPVPARFGLLPQGSEVFGLEVALLDKLLHGFAHTHQVGFLGGITLLN